MLARSALIVVLASASLSASACLDTPKDPAMQRRAQEAAMQAKIEALRATEAADAADREKLRGGGKQDMADRIEAHRLQVIRDRAQTERQLAELKNTPLPKATATGARPAPARSGSEKAAAAKLACGG